MDRLIALPEAKLKVRELLDYIELVETYEADTLEKLIIKEYAYTNSMNQVLKVLEERCIMMGERPIEKSDIVAVLKSKAKDPLHKIVRRGYFLKTRPNRRR